MLTSASNIYISDKAPSEYLSEIIAKSGKDHLVSSLASCLVTEEALNAALNDDYDAFLDARAKTLHAHALQLCGWTDAGDIEPDDSDFDDDSEDSTTD